MALPFLPPPVNVPPPVRRRPSPRTELPVVSPTQQAVAVQPVVPDEATPTPTPTPTPAADPLSPLEIRTLLMLKDSDRITSERALFHLQRYFREVLGLSESDAAGRASRWLAEFQASQGGAGLPIGGTVSGPGGETVGFLLNEAAGAPPSFGELTDRQIESQTQQGRRRLFNQFQAGQGRNPLLTTPLAQRVQRDRFDPLSARFVLETLNEPFGPLEANAPVPGDFRSFLGSDRASAFSPEQFQSGFEQLAPLFGADNPQGLREGQDEILALLRGDEREGDAVARNLILQSVLSGTNPLLQPFAESLLNQRFNAFRDQDQETALFAEFVNRNLNF